MYQLFAPSRRHNRSDENETTSRNDRGCNINQCMHKIIIIARLREIIPSVLNFNRISARLKWLPLLPFYRRFLLRPSSRDRSQLRLPPPSPFLIARYGMYLLTSLYALSYVIMQFVERSIVTSWLRFDQKVRKFEHSLNRGGAEVFIEEEKNFIDFYSLRWFTAGWEVITNIFLCDGKNSEVGIMLIDISFWLFVEWPPRSFRRFPCALCLSGTPWMLCLQLLTM